MEAEVSGILGDLIKELKDVTRDTDIEQPLWSVGEWINYLNDGERELCRRAGVLSGTTTINLISGNASYAISAKILEMDEKGYCNYDASYLTKVTEDWLNHNKSTWRTDTGVPVYYCVDYYNSTLTFTPIPADAQQGYTVAIKTKVLPTTDLSMTNFTPSVSSRYYEDLKLWALYRAYSKQDAETNDEKQSAKYYQMFELSVGGRSNANIERIVFTEPSEMRIMVRR